MLTDSRSSSFTSRFGVLDGWRGVCALLVAAHHLEVNGAIYWTPLIRNAWLFVDFFFVLSGFVIAHAYARKLDDGADARSFVIRRFGRLWPLHAAMLLAFVLLELSRLGIEMHSPIADARGAFLLDRSVPAIFTNLFLVQAFNFHDFETWNGPAWSISVEFATYLVFAATCLLAPGRRARIAVSVVLAIVGVLILLRLSRYGMRDTFNWPIGRCLFGFFSGVLTLEVWNAGYAKRFGGTVAEFAALALVFAFIVFAPRDAALEYFAPPVFALAVLVFSSEKGVVSRLLQTRPAAALGRWSYSIYMGHTLLLALLFSGLRVLEMRFGQAWLEHLANGRVLIAPRSGLASIAIMAAYLAATIAFAALTFRAIEQPGRRLFNRWAAAPRTAEMAPQIT